MIILLPLALIGAGAFIYFLLFSASHAAPLAIAMAAAVVCKSTGASAPVIALTAIAAFAATISLARFCMLTAPQPIRLVIISLIAVPASIAGYQVGGSIAALAQLSGPALAITVALLTGCGAAIRMIRPAA